MSADLVTGNAQAEADAAARRAGVTILLADSVERSHAAAAVIDRIWEMDDGGSLMEPNLLRALEHADNYVAIAVDGAGQPVGVCAGFFSSPRLAQLHSHIAGVTPGFAGRGVGFAMKLHQRAWTLERGVSRMVWTFDPLIRRNARFNLHRLGATATEYLPDFYGQMSDARNSGHGSDRLLVEWSLEAAPGGTAQDTDGLAEWVAVSPGDRPVLLERPHPDTAGTVALPPDIELLRRIDPDAARAWREVTGEVFRATLLAGSHRITGVDGAGRYRLEPRT